MFSDAGACRHTPNLYYKNCNFLKPVHTGDGSWSWSSSSRSRQQFRAASAGVTLLFEAPKWAHHLCSERKTWHQCENRDKVIDQFMQEEWVGPSVCHISPGFPSLQTILDNQPSFDIQWFGLWPQGLYNSLVSVCFLLVMGLCFVCLISVTYNKGKHPAGCQF